MYVDPHICSDSHLCFPHIHLSRKKAMCLQRQIFFFYTLSVEAAILS